MDFLALPLALGLIALCLTNWRAGILCAVFAGFAQDILRKLTPGEPVHFVMLAAVVFTLAAAAAVARGLPLSLRPLAGMHPSLRFPLTAWVVLVLLQCGHTLFATGNIYLAAIGAIAYLLPLGVLIVAVHYGTRSQDIERLLVVYVVLAAIMGSGIYLEVFGAQWKLLEPVGEGLYVYPEYWHEVRLPQGFYRTPEVAAWHMTTALCLLSVLVLSGRWRYGVVAALLLSVFLLFAVLFAGRRKMFVEIIAFAALYGILSAYVRTGIARFAGYVAAAVAAAIFVAFLVNDNLGDTERAHLGRTTVTVSEIADRLQLMTTDSIGRVVRRNGFFGSGAGTGSQGAQHFGGGAALVGGGAEGGLSKVLAELGILGLVLLILVGFGFMRSFKAVLRGAGTSGDIFLHCGLIAFLVVQLPVFAAAAQIYGDPFVLIVLGLLTGIVLASPLRALAERRQLAQPVARLSRGSTYAAANSVAQRRTTIRTLST